MSFHVGHVEGGTGAGRKRPPKPKHQPWSCVCLVQSDPQSRVLALETKPGYLSRCPGCGTERP